MVVGVVALRVALMQDEVAICDTIDAHVHNGLIAHAHSHTTIAATSPVTLNRLARLPVFLAITQLLPHVVLFVIVRLTASALRALMSETFFGGLELCLFIRLHRLLLGVDLATIGRAQARCVTYVDLGRREADHGYLVLLARCGRSIFVIGNLLALAALKLRVLSLLLLLLKLLDMALLKMDSCGNLCFVPLIFAGTARLVVHLNDGELTT